MGQTLDLIESLNVRTVIPGHGAVFAYRAEVMQRARQRLAWFIEDPMRHANYCAKVLLKFKLLEVQRQPLAEFLAWAGNTAHLQTLHRQWFAREQGMNEWLHSMLADLQRAGATSLHEGLILDR